MTHGRLYLIFFVGLFIFVAWLPKDRGIEQLCTQRCTVHVDHVIDGDTFKSNGLRVRIESLRADEADTQSGQVQTECLRRLIEGKSITIIPHGLDKYGRTLATITNQHITC